MTAKDAFSSEEWQTVLAGPPAAGMIVVTASHGGTFRETIAMSKAYAEARSEHGDSELLDEIVAAKPKLDHTLYHSPEELRDSGLEHLRNAVALLQSKAAPGEVDDYRRFVLNLAGKVAAAHREGGQSVSPAEAQAIDQITAALGPAASLPGSHAGPASAQTRRLAPAGVRGGVARSARWSRSHSRTTAVPLPPAACRPPSL